MIKAGPARKFPRFLTLSILLVVLSAAMLFSPLARAQAQEQAQAGSRSRALDDHVDGMTISSVANPETGTKDGLKVRTKPLRVDVDLVLVPVTVTDTLNHPVTWLHKNDFELLDAGQQQSIRLFSQEDAPMSIALVLDVSNSMTDRVSIERDALARFFDNCNKQDEYFAIAVSDRPVMVAGPTSDTENIQNKLAAIQPAGYTALLDSISLALDKLQSARYARKAILIISDGGENTSRFGYREIRALAEESDVLIYAIRPVEAVPVFRTLEERFGGRLLSGITEATGGRTVSLGDNKDVPAAAAEISWELRSLYVLGFQPTQVLHDGKTHKLKVRIVEHDNLHAHYKSQYAAPVR